MHGNHAEKSKRNQEKYMKNYIQAKFNEIELVINIIVIYPGGRLIR